MITAAQLRELFARHCACRPLDLSRAEDDHAAIHDCDTAILRDVQVALGILQVVDVDQIQVLRAARERCAEYLALVPNAHGGYAPPEETLVTESVSKSETPSDRLTRICNTLLDTFNASPEKQEADRAIVFLINAGTGGIGMTGYTDDREALADLIVYLRAIFRARGQDLHFVPVGTTPPKERA